MPFPTDARWCSCERNWRGNCGHSWNDRQLPTATTWLTSYMSKKRNWNQSKIYFISQKGCCAIKCIWVLLLGEISVCLKVQSVSLFGFKLVVFIILSSNHSILFSGGPIFFRINWALRRTSIYHHWLVFWDNWKVSRCVLFTLSILYQTFGAEFKSWFVFYIELIFFSHYPPHLFVDDKKFSLSATMTKIHL